MDGPTGRFSEINEVLLKQPVEIIYQLCEENPECAFDLIQHLLFSRKEARNLAKEYRSLMCEYIDCDDIDTEDMEVRLAVDEQFHKWLTEEV